MNFRERNIVVTDIETTGLDPKVHDIIEIGSILVNQDLEQLDYFESKIAIQNPKTVTEEALVTNGYNSEDWKKAPQLGLVMSEFYHIVQDGVLASWNITFEHDFIEEAFRRSAIKNPMDYHRIDIPSLAWLEFPELQSVSLSSVAQRIGLKEEPRPHRAMTGAQYALDILRNIRDRHEQRKSA